MAGKHASGKPAKPKGSGISKHGQQGHNATDPKPAPKPMPKNGGGK